MIDDVQLIKDYADEYYFIPPVNWPEDEQDYMLYSRSACYEIIEELEKNPNKPTIEIISKFYSDMDRYLEMQDVYNPKIVEGCDPASIFITAKDVARDIGLLFV